MINLTFDFGVEINGIAGGDFAHRLNTAFAWYNSAFDLTADSSGVIADPDAAATGAGPGDGPNFCIWRQSGAPFGSMQTQHLITSGALPPGLIQVQKEVRAFIMPGFFFPWPIGTLNEFGISGTPLAIGVYTGHFGASGAYAGEDFTITIALAAGCPLISILPLTLDNWYLDIAYPTTVLVAVDGVDPYVFDIVSGELPTGLTLAADGTLSGTPTVLGTFEFYVRAIDDNGCAGVKLYTIIISEKPPEYAPDPGADIAGKTVPIVWVEWTLDDDSVEVYAKVPLLDRASYYHGYKRPLIMSFGEVRRALSDRFGQIEGTSFSYVASDLDARVRALLFGSTTRYNFVNRSIVARMISDIDRRRELTPRTIFRGLLRNYGAQEQRKFEFIAEDFLAAATSPFNLDKVIPRRLIGDVFTDAPVEMRPKRLPLIYGSASDEASATSTPPTLTGTTARGAYVNAGRWIGGFGELVSDADIPVNIVVTLNGAASGELPVDVQNAEYGFIVTAVDADGVESDPSTFYYNGPGDGRGSFAFGPIGSTQVVPDSTRSITISWDASTGAVKYRVYLGTFYYTAQWGQFIEVDAPTLSATFDKHWGFAVTNPTPDYLSTDAQFCNFAQHWEYAVLAVMIDGVTGLSDWQWSDCSPYRRPLRLEWLPVTGALEYWVLRRARFGDWDRKWIVPSGTEFFEDDLLDTDVEIITGSPTPTGIVPLAYIGTEVVSGFPWHRYLVQQGCSHEVITLYVDGVPIDAGNYGVLWLVPGKAGWPLGDNFIDRNGVRCTVIYGRGPQSDAVVSGSAKLSANVEGLEDVGDGSGDLITSLHQIYKHFVINFGFQDSNGGIGGWLDAPEWEAGVSQVDEQSFDDAEAIAELRLVGGFPGAAVIGANDEVITLREVIKRFNLSANVRSGFNRNSQFMVSMLDLRPAALASARNITQQNNIIAGSFSTPERVDELYNVGVYSYARDFKLGTWRNDSDELEAGDSIANYRETKRMPTLELWFVRHAGVALEIMTRELLFTRNVPRRVIWAEPLSGLASELGEVARIDHTDGIGPNGYVGNAVWIDRHDFDPNVLKTRMEAYDVEKLFSGGFILGDDTWAVDWMTASPQQRLYGFLCDETTGTLSDGTEGKRLR